ncbi:MAG: transposase [Acidimicrobiaceae bacterium]|nr:transposase [Acidimicrobiaceae bacterium]
MAMVKRYSPEVRDRAKRMVTDHRGEYASQWAAIQSVAQKLGMAPKTLQVWVRQAQIDTGETQGVTTDERECTRQLERENFELKRANEILRAASIFMPTPRLCRKPFMKVDSGPGQ